MSTGTTTSLLSGAELLAMIEEDGAGIETVVTYEINSSQYSPATGKVTGGVPATQNIKAIMPFDHKNTFDGAATNGVFRGVALIPAEELELVPVKMISLAVGSRIWWVTGMEIITVAEGVIGYMLNIEAKR